MRVFKQALVVLILVVGGVGMAAPVAADHAEGNPPEDPGGADEHRPPCIPPQNPGHGQPICIPPAVANNLPCANQSIVTQCGDHSRRGGAGGSGTAFDNRGRSGSNGGASHTSGGNGGASSLSGTGGPGAASTRAPTTGPVATATGWQTFLV